MNRWILQMGYPVVTIDTRTGNVSQKHFLLEKEAVVERKSEFKYVVKHLHWNILFLDHLKLLPRSLTAVLNLSYEWFVPIKWMKTGQEHDQLWLLQKSGTLNLLKSLYTYHQPQDLATGLTSSRSANKIAGHSVMGLCTPSQGPIHSRQRIKYYLVAYSTGGWRCIKSWILEIRFVFGGQGSEAYKTFLAREKALSARIVFFTFTEDKKSVSCAKLAITMPGCFGWLPGCC